ncbi:MAG: TRAP transporter small permease [Marivibrio sp.]|uniref:TRAP transporter small permease n=1 Tax=Marivibrio sp. TaxID=2039719 RepID=UPI0032EF8F76
MSRPASALFSAALDALARLSFGAAGAALAGIVGLYVLEVGLRYFFAAPTTWSQEWIGYLLLAVIFLAAPDITRRGAHIAIDLLAERLAPERGRLLARLGAALGALVAGSAAAIVSGEAWTQAERGVMTNAAHPIPRFLLTTIIAYGLGVSALFFLRRVVGERVRNAASSEPGA